MSREGFITRDVKIELNLNIQKIINKKLSYGRETARQLPTWRGLGPPAHSRSAPSGYIYAYGRIRNPQQT